MKVIWGWRIYFVTNGAKEIIEYVKSLSEIDHVVLGTIWKIFKGWRVSNSSN